MSRANDSLSSFRNNQNPTDADVEDLVSNCEQALSSMSDRMRRDNGLDDNKLREYGTNPELVAAFEQFFLRGGRRADDATDAAADAAATAKGNILKRNPKYTTAILGTFIGLAIRTMLVTEEECKKNCSKLLQPPPTLGLFGGHTNCKDCSNSDHPKVGPEDGGYSTENCCCQPPEGKILTKNTSKTCGSFCNEDCSLENRLADARAAAIEDPVTAGSGAFDKSFDAVTSGITGGIDIATFLATYGVQIIVGLVVLIALPIIFYLFKGIITGVKESGKVVSDAAKGQGAKIVKEQVKKLPGMRRSGRKKWKK